MNVETLLRKYAPGNRDFCNAYLSLANLTRAKLSVINLIRADLYRVKLSHENSSIDCYLLEEKLIYLGEEL